MCIAIIIFIPPQTKLGYIGITLSVLLSVNPSARLFAWCPGHIFLPLCRIWIIFHTTVVHDPRVCHDLDPRSYLQGQGHCAHIHQNRCPGHTSLLPCSIWIIFHTIVVKYLRVCHDIGPRSHFEGQGHSTHIVQIFVRPITPHCHV